MNVYEETHKLAKAIKESDEYIQFMDLKKKIEEKPELDKMIKDFMQKQIEIQTKQFMESSGDKKPEINMESMQELTRVIMADPLAAAFIQAEMRFSLMMNDVYKIISDSIGIGNLL